MKTCPWISGKNFSATTVQIRRAALLSVILLFVSAGTLFAASGSGIKVPAMNGPVNDNASLINSSDEAKLSEYLNRINDKTGIQLAVLTIDSLEGNSIEAYSMAVCEAWQLGQKGEDNGVLLLVAFEDHEFRIEVGYGLEGTLTDMASGIILRNVITPYFKEGRYSTGILAGMQAIGIAVAPTEAGLMEGVPQTTVSSSSSSDGDESFAGFIFVLVFFMIMVTLSNKKARLRKYRRYGYRKSGLSQAAETLFWLNMLNNSSSSHKSSGFGGSSGFRSGGFGGGFSGGGGHFGGGGASGKW